jgi:hypothetical protein
MLPKIHSKIEQALRFPNHGTVIDGVISSQVPDTSGELIDIAGMDITSLNEDGVLNTEHQNPYDKKFFEMTKEEQANWAVIIGRCIFAKKIFKEEDCESDRERVFWQDLQVPFIYGGFELFDNEGHSGAKDACSIIRHYHYRGLPVVIRFSVEGSTLDRQGNYLRRALARRCAATIKPCNRSAISSLVAEAQKEHSSELSKSELSYSLEGFSQNTEVEYFPLISDNSVELLETLVSDIKKTLTLGSYNAAPGTLTGGAALSKEQWAGDRDVLKGRVLAAFRDWDKVSPLKSFLKHQLPDVDDKALNRFVRLARDIRLIKAEVQEDLHAQTPSLPKLETKPPKGAQVFKNKYVMPGEVELIAGPFQGSKLKLLHLDENYAYVEPMKAGDQAAVKVNKLNRKAEGSHFHVAKEPEELKLPIHVDASKHSVQHLTDSHEQQALMHGVDLSSLDEGQNQFSSTNSRSPEGSSLGWGRSALGKEGYVKPAVEYGHEDLKTNQEHYIPTAHREVLYHLLAKNFFGLGEHVPVTAAFKHPTTGHDHSVMEKVPFAEHFNPKASSGANKDRLLRAGDSGQLDKLAIMDSVLMSTDRNRLNYLVSPKEPGIHLIDNALMFNPKEQYIPQYLLDYHAIRGDSVGDAPMHPHAQQWLIGLDPFVLERQMQKAKVHPALIQESVKRLLSLQSASLMGHSKKNDILHAHEYHMKGTQNAE